MHQPTQTPQTNAPDWNLERDRIQQVGLDYLEPDPANPRTTGDKKSIDELTASIATHGVTVPLIIRPNRDDPSKAIIVSGHRRYRAAVAAHLMTVPCILTDGGASELEILKNLLIDNIHREQLPPIDTARTIRAMMLAEHLTQTQVAKLINLAPNKVSQLLGLLDGIPEKAQRAVNSGAITVQCATLITRLPEGARLEACRQVLRGELDYSTLQMKVKGPSTGRSRVYDSPSKAIVLMTDETIDTQNGVVVRIQSPRKIRVATMIKALQQAIACLEEENQEEGEA